MKAKEQIQKNLSKPGFQILFLSLIGLFTYWPALTASKIVNPDSSIILPNLRKNIGIESYLKALTNLETFDFQPVRDASFFIDLYIEKSFDVNSLVTINLILWIASCFTIGKVINKKFPDFSNLVVFFIVLGFLVYPLFSQSIAWGIARKHILSFFFILLATFRIINSQENISYKDQIFITLFYLLSILSQPINILWPIWVSAYLYSKKTLNFKKNIFLQTSLYFFLMIVFLINRHYYQNSLTFLRVFPPTDNELFEVSDRILALGHYIFQLIFPYLLSFTYTLGDWSTLIGLGILGLVIILFLNSKSEKRDISLWILFTSLPLAMMLLRSKALYDTYLLVPAFGLLIGMIITFRKVFAYKLILAVFSPFIIFWIFSSRSEATLWANEIEMVKVNFERRPSCLTASHYLRISYENEKPPDSPVAKKFLYTNECSTFRYKGPSLINLHSYMLYYENDLTFFEREQNLIRLSKLGIFPHLILISFYIKHAKTELAFKETDELQRWGSRPYKQELSPLVKRVVLPFCTKHDKPRCLESIKPFI